MGARRVFREYMFVESLNLKTASFFLAFIPQSVSPASGRVTLQVMPLGIVAVH
jgi:threonine/homoserine/homoserine lactone efflux protein